MLRRRVKQMANLETRLKEEEQTLQQIEAATTLMLCEFRLLLATARLRRAVGSCEP